MVPGADCHVAVVAVVEADRHPGHRAPSCTCDPGPLDIHRGAIAPLATCAIAAKLASILSHGVAMCWLIFVSSLEFQF
jgi:hypothetical protein